MELRFRSPCCGTQPQAEWHRRIASTAPGRQTTRHFFTLQNTRKTDVRNLQQGGILLRASGSNGFGNGITGAFLIYGTNRHHPRPRRNRPVAPGQTSPQSSSHLEDLSRRLSSHRRRFHVLDSKTVHRSIRLRRRRKARRRSLLSHRRGTRTAQCRSQSNQPQRSPITIMIYPASRTRRAEIDPASRRIGATEQGHRALDYQQHRMRMCQHTTAPTVT